MSPVARRSRRCVCRGMLHLRNVDCDEGVEQARVKLADPVPASAVDLRWRIGAPPSRVVVVLAPFANMRNGNGAYRKAWRRDHFMAPEPRAHLTWVPRLYEQPPECPDFTLPNDRWVRWYRHSVPRGTTLEQQHETKLSSKTTPFSTIPRMVSPKRPDRVCPRVPTQAATQGVAEASQTKRRNLYTDSTEHTRHRRMVSQKRPDRQQYVLT